MLTFYLSPIFKARGIEKPYTFLVKAGLTPHAANRILNSDSRSFRLDHVELLCKALLCEPNDLLLWAPEKGEHVSDNHPLSKLIQNDADNNWQDAYNNMSYKQLKDVTKTIIEKEKNKE